MKISVGIILFIVVLLIGGYFFFNKNNAVLQRVNPVLNLSQEDEQLSNPLQVTEMRKREYPGSELKIEETLSPGSNYERFVASYLSDGNKIYGLLTIPTTEKPEGGFPVIIFNHGYIPPREYTTLGRYIAYTDAFSRNGFVVFKSDYRGHGESEGSASGAYFSPDYTVDVINGMESVKKLPEVNPAKIGMWGHSMGGNITERVLAVKPQELKAAVIWAGVVGSYSDMFEVFFGRRSRSIPEGQLQRFAGSRNQFLQKYGSPSANPKLWFTLDPINYLSDVNVPIQLHQGDEDEEVPPELEKRFYDELKDLNKNVELFTYPGADHNIASPSFEVAMQRSVEFFKKYLQDR